ncbi:MAG: hypothetical protein LBB56_00855 [Chitinispirillales bacterium]|jgi:hypothetical protein|nr:hypothetical protein [Chitinispirillales bacterium]
MSKRRFGVLAMAVFCALVLVSCRGGDGSGADTFKLKIETNVFEYEGLYLSLRGQDIKDKRLH